MVKKFDTLTDDCSFLQPSSTLVSAMKGGRAQNGTMQKLDLHVKWAPEVYDPPSTSVSHTVNHHQQPKAKKKDKCKRKGKLSRGNVGERKHGNRKSLINGTSDPHSVRYFPYLNIILPLCCVYNDFFEYHVTGYMQTVTS